MAKPEHKQFKVGDVVMLKSGGFPMTVTRATNHEGTVAAGWFAYQTLCSETFPVESLESTTKRFNASTGAIE